MLRNLASSLILTERDAESDANEPKVKGRVTTTLHKAKEVRPLVEKCVTIARRSLKHQETAREFETDAERGSDQWKQWRSSDQWQKWCAAIAPTVAARLAYRRRKHENLEGARGRAGPRFFRASPYNAQA